MKNRQSKILKIIIKEHIKTAEPISSGLLVEKFKLPYSSATVRNEMAELEREGYIFQPHTSAGRIPTSQAYNFYIKNFLNLKRVKGKEIKIFRDLNKNDEQSIKEIVKSLASASGLAVFWAKNKNDFYYTGISNLLSQSEFSEIDKAIELSKVIDHLDQIISELYLKIKEEIQILIGEDSPFGNESGTIITKYKDDNSYGIIGIIGPLRMDYEKCLGLVNWVREIL